MDIMDLLAQARPGSLDPGPEADRRASDLARAIAAPRDGMTSQPGASRRPGVRRASPPARVIATGISVAVLAGIAGVVVALSASGTPSARPQPAAAHAGTAVATPGELRNAILTAFNGVGGDVFYAKITEIYPGKNSQWNGVSETGPTRSSHRPARRFTYVPCSCPATPTIKVTPNRSTPSPAAPRPRSRPRPR